MKTPQLGFGFAPEGGDNGRKQRRAAKAKARYWADPEKFRAQSLAWQQSPEGKAYAKAWRAANRERSRAKRRELRAGWKAAGLCAGCGGDRESAFKACAKCRQQCVTAIAKNRDKHLAVKRAAYWRDPKGCIAKSTAWRIANKDKANANARLNYRKNLEHRREVNRLRAQARSKEIYAVQKELRTKRIAAGLCAKCGGPRTQVRQMCDLCAARVRGHAKKWAAKNPDATRSHKLKQMYGLTIAEWNAMFAAQGRKCDICGSEKPQQKNWATDHDHSTGKLRSILCGLCNAGLGAFKDDPTLLANAIEYLRKHRLSIVV